VVLIVLVLLLAEASAWRAIDGCCCRLQWWSSRWCSPWWRHRLGERWLLLQAEVVIIVRVLSSVEASSWWAVFAAGAVVLAVLVPSSVQASDW
jgi:hypothetical protein